MSDFIDESGRAGGTDAPADAKEKSSGEFNSVTRPDGATAKDRAGPSFPDPRSLAPHAKADRGADRAAFMATLIMTAKLNDIDPQAWLAGVLASIADTPITRLEQLLPWKWTPPTIDAQAA